MGWYFGIGFGWQKKGFDGIVTRQVSWTSGDSNPGPRTCECWILEGRGWWLDLGGDGEWWGLIGGEGGISQRHNDGWKKNGKRGCGCDEDVIMSGCIGVTVAVILTVYERL